MAGHDEPESAVTIRRNQRSRWTGIRTGIICRAKVVFFAWQGLRVMHRHSHARTLMFANAASVLTQAVVRILKFGVLLAASSFTGRGVMSQSTITGLGASTRSVCLSHSL
jgi:hypothetical protein